jgi:hypothetical protein
MADTKISALTAATTPLAGTEVLPIVQSGTTKKVAIADVTAGRAVSAASLALTTSPLPVTSGGTGTATAFTAGSVVFAGASGVYSQDNANYFWDDANNRLGLGTATPATGFHLFNTTARPFTAGNFSATWSFGQSGANFAFRENGSASDYVSIDGNNGNTTIGVGNLVIGTSGKGIDFSATPGTGTSELLADYEEGTWTPTDASGAGLSFTVGNCTYTKIGRQVTAVFDITFPVTANGSTQLLGGLPFSASAAAQGACGGFVAYTTYANALNLLISGATTVSFRLAAGGSNNSNAAYSTATIRGSVVYFV